VIAYQIIGSERVIQMLAGVPEKTTAAAKAALGQWSTELAGYIKASKLSGSPLHRRSGALSASVHPYTAETSNSESGGARAGSNIPYAAIHEFGGTIPAHQVVAMNAKALCFTVDGVRRFAKSVQIPAIHMPERSYMRSAFDEKVPQGIDMVRAAVKAAIAT